MSQMENLDRALRVQKRSFDKCNSSIQDLLKQPVSLEIIEQLNSIVNLDFLPLKKDIELKINELILLVVGDSEISVVDKEKKENDYFKELDKVKNTFHKLQGKIRAFSAPSALVSSTPPRHSFNSSSEEATCTSQPKLPKIPVPKFDGELKKFYDFKNLFISLVHENKDLSNVQKLYYLKASLVGKATDILRDYELSDSAYNEAWEYFLSRFENKKAIIRTYFRELLNIPKVKNEAGIRELLDEVNLIIRGLRISGEPVDGCMSSFVTYFISTKLDDATRRDWENSLSDNSSHPKFKTLDIFLQNRSFTAMENDTLDHEKLNFNKAKKSEKTNSTGTPNKRGTDSISSFANTVHKPVCHLCSESHYLNQCAQFQSKNTTQRFEFVKMKKLCLNCLKSNHSSLDCRCPTFCRKCSKKHHTLLHFDEGPKKPEEDKTKPTSSSTPQVQSQKTNMSTFQNKDVLLPSAVVLVRLGVKSVFARALLDHCSQPNVVVDSFLKRHHIKATQTSATQIIGIGNNSTNTTFTTNLDISSRFDKTQLNINFDVVSNIPYKVPETVISKLRSNISGIDLAEMSLKYPDVDLIIGAEYYEDLMTNEKFKEDSVTFHKSNFGWVISGPITGTDFPTTLSSCHFNSFAIESQIAKFWEIEEIPAESLVTSEAEACNTHFEKTFSRAPDGRFIVRLPFKENPVILGDNFKNALRSFNRNSYRLTNIQQSEYSKFMKEYVDMNHMKETIYEESPCRYFIPHKLVERPTSTTTKFRVVFNASYRGINGKSLNDILMCGPSIQSELFDILVLFRVYKIAFIADIEKMYRQVRVHDNDSKYQQILWKEVNENLPRTYELQTVTYGTTSASFLATKCLEKLADEISEENPHEAIIIRTCFYMDDLLTGADTVEEALRIQKTIHNTLAKGKFPLRKYISNSQEFTSCLENTLLSERNDPKIAFNSTLVLGLIWSPAMDTLKITLESFDLPEKLTKRVILSTVSRVFDVIGILSPVTLQGKLIMQNLWSKHLSWDENVSEETKFEFLTYCNDLTTLQSFSFDRRYSKINRAGVVTEQLIGFCDSSKRAYCAVVYLRQIARDGEINVSFVCAKTRVAPLKVLTIPRLELLAAVLLSRLISRISKNLNITIDNTYLFSDSQIVLAWLKNGPHQFQLFVANRVKQILEKYSCKQWFYINTVLNPADMATRPINARKFLEPNHWTKGPDFLVHNFESFITENTFSTIKFDELPEMRTQKNKVCNLATFQVDGSYLHRFSSFTKLINVTCYILRILPKVQKLSSTLSKEEQDNAFNVLIRLSQRNCFASDISRLENNIELTNKSRIRSLSPFLDENNILRVGGRLKSSNLSFEKKHPIILNVRCNFVKLFIHHIHTKYFHCSRLVIVTHFSRFWLIGSLNNVVKNVLRNCVLCKRLKGEVLTQIMSQLPPSRVNYSRPFSHVGIDFCGPFTVKCTNHRSTKYLKSYAAVFVCFVIRAVHIEVVSDLSTPSFIALFRRFYSRRGIPLTVHSDNGTNFVGANNSRMFTTTEIKEFASREKITWKFIPPSAPHHGGLWESAVKSAKSLLVKATLNQVLTFEELNTIFVQIESILNSRPLCRKASTLDTCEILTPGHFLVGDHLSALPEPDDLKGSLAKRWGHVQHIITSFWNVWHKTYLNELQQKYKWIHPKKNIDVGEIVCIKEDFLRPLQWKMGRVVKVFPDKYGDIRAADVQVADGSVKKRPIVKLVVLLSPDEAAHQRGE